MDKHEIKPCDVLLVQMPHTELEWPSIALGLLKAEATRGGVRAKVVYSSHRFVEQLGYAFYERAQKAMQTLIMSWEILFAEYAGFTTNLSVYDLIDTGKNELETYFQERNQANTAEAIMDSLAEIWPVLKEQAAFFLNAEADYILAHKPRIVGCSIMTQQRNASLALLKVIKERAPEVTTILGGGICIGETATAFLNAAPQLDYVFTGEGDSVFAPACRLILDGRKDELARRFPSFLHAGGTPVTCTTTDLNQMAVPDFSEYFAQLSAEDFGPRLVPRIMIEGSRGCWWGEVERCRFCGLHYSKEALTYREKNPVRVWHEIQEQVTRYQCPYISFTDCILSHEFIRTLPDLSPQPPIFLFSECKSNLTEDDVKRLRNAGFGQLQPGIEALQDDLLVHMHKGNRAIKHVELLKYFRLYGIRVTWNLLHSLPGDKKEWYEETLALMPLLHHFSPPTSVSPMILMRCSPFREQGERFGLKTIAPQLFHYAMNPRDCAFTNQTADMLVSPEISYDYDIAMRLNKAAQDWKKEFRGGVRLTMTVLPDQTVIHDLRRVRTAEGFTLTGVQKAVYSCAYSVVSLSHLHEQLDKAWGSAPVEDAVQFFLKNNLAVQIRGELLALALPHPVLPWRQVPQSPVLGQETKGVMKNEQSEE